MKKINLMLMGVLTGFALQAQCWRITASDSQHSLGIKTDGTLWGWGYNWFGQAGPGSNGDLATPQQVDAATNWSIVATGHEHSAGIKTNGTLWTWGRNPYGQLGYGNMTNQLTPLQVGSATNWKTVDAGSFHNLAIKTDGTLWAWGDNQLGQFGNGTTVSTTSPMQIGSATDWDKIAVSLDGHVLAIKTNGTLWSWGNNADGQLGDGTAVNKISPVQVGSDTDWIQVATGRDHSMALKSNGTIWTWGDNFVGQLGDGANTDKSVPAQMGSDADWAALYSGAQGGLAIKTNKSLWVWGSIICIVFIFLPMCLSRSPATGTMLPAGWRIALSSVTMALYGRGDRTSGTNWEMGRPSIKTFRRRSPGPAAH